MRGSTAAAEQPNTSRRRVATMALAGSLATLIALTAPVAAATKSNGGVRSKGSTSTPPQVSITSPAGGSTVAGTVTVSGSASASAGVASVTVKVDSGSSITATGTTSWSTSLDTATLADGTHTITATATDSGSLTASASVTVTVHNAAGSSTFSSGGFTVADSPVTNTSTTDSLVLVDHGAEAAWGTVSATLYRGAYTWKYYLQLRDGNTGATSSVALPGATSSTVGNYAHAAFNGLGDFWIFGGGGPVTALEWTLSGSPLPTSATLAGSNAWGDSDSRAGGLVRLSSGGLVCLWHQQGSSGAPQGLGIAYRNPAGLWSTTYPLQFMPTASSKQAMAQNPSDGSVWVFNDPDAFAAIGAVHLSETSAGLRVDWTNATLIDDNSFGGNGPDPENPDLEAVPDPSTGTIALAYQSQQRYVFSTSPWVVGSYPVVDRIAADGTMTFVVLPTYVERVTTLGLVVQPGQTWLLYRPVDPATDTFSTLDVSRYANGAWTGPATLGTAGDPYEVVDFAAAAPEFDAVLSDGRLHRFRVS